MSYLKDKIISFFFKNYTAVNSYFPISKWDIIDYFIKKFLLKQHKENKSFHFNFIITSKAEIRIFTPLLNHIFECNSKIKVKLFFAKKDIVFDSTLSQKISESKEIKIESSALSFTEYENAINVVCLDHGYYKKAHKIGVDVITFLNSKNAKTVCIQHGGNQEDYIKGHLSSMCNYQILFGKLIYNRFIDSGFDTKKVCLTGNPLHDKISKQGSRLIFDKERKVISLVTCMHTEYADRPDPRESYFKYVESIYRSVNFNKYILVVKMHPYDSVQDNIYDFVRMNLGLTDNEVRIISAGDTTKTVYDVISASNLIISRASSVIEESLMLNKGVIAFDLYEDGVSKHYDFLLKYSNYKKVIKDNRLLTLAIQELENKVMSDAEIDEIVQNVTYKWDGQSAKRVIQALKNISKLNK